MSDLDSLPPAFHFLIDLGFKLESAHTDEREFGNSVLILRRNNELALRFVSDRGDIFVDVGTARAGWHKLEDVGEFIEGNRPCKGSDTQRLAHILRSRLEEVGRIFEDEAALARFMIFSKQRSESTVDKMFPGHSKR